MRDGGNDRPLIYILVASFHVRAAVQQTMNALFLGWGGSGSDRWMESPPPPKAP